jgi:hypothetical protein
VSGTVAEFGYTARIACAPSVRGAWLVAQARAARHGRRWHLVKETSLAHVLEGLSVALLLVAQAHRDAFSHVGCTTLADCAGCQGRAWCVVSAAGFLICSHRRMARGRTRANRFVHGVVLCATRVAVAGR